MKEGPDIARVAALIGDPARANMLTALMSGKALTPSELAQEAGVTRQTASSHLAKLGEAGLVVERKQGRHKYFALGGEDIAELLEGLMRVAVSAGHLRTRTGPKDAALRKARVCYNHLAGEMGTRLFDSMLARGLLRRDGEALSLTEKGAGFANAFGVDPATLAKSGGAVCRECLDWSERRSHLAGGLGRAFLARMVTLGWAKIDRQSRVVAFSATGAAAFEKLL